jgi:hypothetical protein
MSFWQHHSIRENLIRGIINYIFLNIRHSIPQLCILLNDAKKNSQTKSKISCVLADFLAIPVHIGECLELTIPIVGIFWRC